MIKNGFSTAVVSENPFILFSKILALYQQIYEQKQKAKHTAQAEVKAKKAESRMQDEKLEELFARHPLVKDARCFRLGWWPESEPECFSSWEEA